MIAANLTADTSQARRWLQALATHLLAVGWIGQLVTTQGQLPALYLRNPDAPVLAELVFAWPAHDGTWCFWWPWGQAISHAADAGEAAGIVTRVLRHAGGTQ